MLRIAQDFYEALGISYRRSHRQVPAVGCVNQPKFMGISWHILGCNLMDTYNGNELEIIGTIQQYMMWVGLTKRGINPKYVAVLQ